MTIGIAAVARHEPGGRNATRRGPRLRQCDLFALGELGEFQACRRICVVCTRRQGWIVKCRTIDGALAKAIRDICPHPAAIYYVERLPRQMMFASNISADDIGLRFCGQNLRNDRHRIACTQLGERNRAIRICVIRRMRAARRIRQNKGSKDPYTAHRTVIARRHAFAKPRQSNVLSRGKPVGGIRPAPPRATFHCHISFSVRVRPSLPPIVQLRPSSSVKVVASDSPPSR